MKFKMRKDQLILYTTHGGSFLIDVNTDKDIQVTFMKVADVKTKAFDGTVTRTRYKTTAGSNTIEKA